MIHKLIKHKPRPKPKHTKAAYLAALKLMEQVDCSKAF